MIENIHLWHADRGSYFDRNVNIISWSNDYHIHVGNTVLSVEIVISFYMQIIDLIG
jgi:hypothetical protein